METLLLITLVGVAWINIIVRIKGLRRDVRDNFEKHTADLASLRASLRDLQRALKSSESSANRMHNTAESDIELPEAEIGRAAEPVIRAARG
jgi:hypothetical protein